MNKKKAVEWWTKAAEQGHAEAQCNLGRCYSDGDGVAMDKKKAVEWFTKAAKQGYAGAQFYLRTKTRHKYDSSISIYIDCDYCCSLFEISCGAATLFDAYSMELTELREKYYDKDDEYWRRYDWIKKKV